MNVEIRRDSGIEHIDNLLRGLISLFELSFPTRIRSYYLGGSSSDGTAVGHHQSPNSSDIDLFVIFRGTAQQAENATFHRIVAACQLISPNSLDAHAYSEDDLLHQPRQEASQISFLNVLIQLASILVYGDDIRPELPVVSFPRYVLDVIESGLYHLSIPRQRDALTYPLLSPLTPPLGYPNSDDEFYGYDIVPARPDAPLGTRVLVGITLWISTLILALETGRFAGRKSQSIQFCKAYLPNDQRTQLAMTINDLCKGTWEYALPKSAKDRERLRSLCRDVLALENHYLGLCHDYLLLQLLRGDPLAQQHVTRILQNVIYSDDQIMVALKALEHATDEGVRTGAVKALKLAADLSQQHE